MERFSLLIRVCGLKDIAATRNCVINKIKQANSDEVSKIVMKNSQNKTKLTVEKKEFNLHDDHDSFFTENIEQVNQGFFLSHLF